MKQSCYEITLATNQYSPQSSGILKLNKLLVDVAQSSLDLWKGNDRIYHNFKMQRKGSLLELPGQRPHRRGQPEKETYG